MNYHRGARSATTLACVALACLTDHFLSDRINSPFGVALLILFNIALFTVAIYHFKKAWWVTAILILSLISVPIKTVEAQGAKPQWVLCVIVGGAILVGGSYASYKIYKCAKKNLHPPPPPTNAPPSKPGEWDRMISDASPNAASWFNLPAINCEIDDSVVSSNWVDWEGFPIAYCFAGETNLWQKSTNLLSWLPMSMTFTGWVSQVNGWDYNQVSISYHNGKPFATNWARIDSTGTNYDSLGSVGQIPIDKTKRAEFFRLVPVGVTAQ